jgi:hypothetical protein
MIITKWTIAIALATLGILLAKADAQCPCGWMEGIASPTTQE